eukprot:CAMPEP_0202448318 /NCGR_PEP_ID=MMETSP1360-20130828/7146_1 /ASSEMBLY_ACC=CAM_ASM_000848 /TAXON_ID=515479 /ORGANISM="Licmophora paradoxa, Strain CCMP2313" /LENGTH=226 /DNA_ID=CAMNT_0049065839 /DNA_START=280 /DNA_END=960 /DNA_ORIENTATION=-
MMIMNMFMLMLQLMLVTPCHAAFLAPNNIVSSHGGGGGGGVNTRNSQNHQNLITRHMFVSPPPPPPPPMEEEMQEEKKKESPIDHDTNSWTKVPGGFIPNIQRKLIYEVQTLQDYKDTVVGADELIVVVKFYAKWCGACKAIEPLYKRMAAEHRGNVKFVQVPVSSKNALLHSGLGVPSVPFGHIYHKNAGLVEEMRIKRQNFHTFEQALQTYVDGQCELKPELEP